MTDVKEAGTASRASEKGRTKPSTPAVAKPGASVPTKAGDTVIVNVFAKDPTGVVEFSHEWRFHGGNNKGGGKIEIPKAKKGDPGHPIHFYFFDETMPKRNLSFVLDPKNVIWVSRTGCPMECAEDSEITDIVPAKKLLKVYDNNEVECELHYNLRFEPDPDEYSYDPEIKNGGKV